MAIIGISGKLKSGKDTVGKIIQYLTSADASGTTKERIMLGESIDGYHNSTWKSKKYATKLKSIASLLTGIPTEKFEDHDFKDSLMSEEWWHYMIRKNNELYLSMRFPTLEEASKYLTAICFEIEDKEYHNSLSIELVKPTVRQFLQQLGTETMRNNLHSHTWENALFSDYFETHVFDKGNRFPDWLITDVRYPNELDAIKIRHGIVIRVNRWIDKVVTRDEALDLFFQDKEVFFIDDNGVESQVTDRKDCYIYSKFATQLPDSTHTSETALDNAKFDYVIENNSTLEELIEKVKTILEIENIIKPE